MTTDTTERGLERIICAALTGHPRDPPRDNTLTEIPPTQKQVIFDEIGKTRVPYGGAGNPPNPNGLKIDYLWK